MNSGSVAQTKSPPCGRVQVAAGGKWASSAASIASRRPV